MSTNKRHTISSFAAPTPQDKAAFEQLTLEEKRQLLAAEIEKGLEGVPRKVSAEDIMAKMPGEMVGKDKALYLAALKNTLPMYSETGLMDPKGAAAVLAVFSEGSPEVAKANIDVSKTYTNSFVEQARKTTGLNAK